MVLPGTARATSRAISSVELSSTTLIWRVCRRCRDSRGPRRVRRSGWSRAGRVTELGRCRTPSGGAVCTCGGGVGGGCCGGGRPQLERAQEGPKACGGGSSHAAGENSSRLAGSKGHRGSACCRGRGGTPAAAGSGGCDARRGHIGGSCLQWSRPLLGRLWWAPPPLLGQLRSWWPMRMWTSRPARWCAVLR